MGPQTYTPRNHISVLTNPDIVKSKISQELQAGRIAGPFPNPPMPNFICSPLGLVPKKTSGQHRMIHDLSYPKWGQSVNSTISPGSATVQYELLDDAINILHKVGRGALVAKADIEAAFRLIPLHPNSYHLTGFSWEGLYYFDRALPFGASTSCATFEKFSTALQWILQHHFQVPHVSHIIDDFMFFGPANTKVTHRSLQKFFILAEDLGIPVKQDKTVLPSTRVELHGIQVDTVDWTLTLPEDKKTEALAKIASIRKKQKTTLQELQSLIGTLNFATKVIVPGRAFLRRLIDLTVNVRNSTHHIHLNSAARADLQAWSIFLEHFNGKYMISDPSWLPASAIKLHVASGPDGFAVVFGRRWARSRWNPTYSKYPATPNILCPITVAIRLWANDLANHNLQIYSESQDCSTAINSSTSKDPMVMALIRPLVTTCMLHNIRLHSTTSSSCSALAKDLASFQVADPTSARPHLFRQTPLPPEFLPWNR